MSNPAIQAEGVGKRYRIGVADERPDTLFQAGLAWLRSPLTNYRQLRSLSRFSENGSAADVIWALDDVSFEVEEGEVVGIIGRNGAGKSTLLKVLSRITPPTRGRIVLNGRVASLLEVGTGFHPELTGRENVYLNGTVLGMRKAEIDRRFDEIVAFSGVEKFIDTPIKRYSSGMQVRLAFSVAAHLEPEILLIDEVLAVGDAEFQKRCLGKMSEVAQAGRTVIFVSHQMAAVENLCQRVMYLREGKIVADGPPKTIISTYLREIRYLVEEVPLAVQPDRRGNGKVRLTAFHIETPEGLQTQFVQPGDDFMIVLGFEADEDVSRVNVGVSLTDSLERLITVHFVNNVRDYFGPIPTSGQFRCYVRGIPLIPGDYRVGAMVYAGGEIADMPMNGVGYLHLQEGDFFGTGRRSYQQSIMMLDADWSVASSEAIGREYARGNGDSVGVLDE